MNLIRAILEAAADGTLHLPVPPELRHGKVQVTATLQPMPGVTPTAAPDAVARRRAALSSLRRSGGLRRAIPDPAAWQRANRDDRPLPGRD